MNSVHRIVLMIMLTLILVGTLFLVKAEYEKAFLFQENRALLNNVANLQRALAVGYPEIDTTLPLLVLNIEVTDALAGDWTQVVLASSKTRDDCPVRTSRFIRDSNHLEYEVNDSTRSETQLQATQKYIITQFQVRVPLSVPPGTAEYQSRSQYTCEDGSIFVIATPWAPFNVIAP